LWCPHSADSHKSGADAVLSSTGASGIGKSVAVGLVGAGFTVIGTSRNAAKAEPVAGVHFVDLDVASDSSVEKAIAGVIKAHGRIDVLVNNAGIGYSGAADTSFEANSIRPDRPLPVYDERRRVFEEFMNGAVKDGDDPATVAKAIVAAATDENPKLRYSGSSRAPGCRPCAVSCPCGCSTGSSANSISFPPDPFGTSGNGVPVSAVRFEQVLWTDERAAELQRILEEDLHGRYASRLRPVPDGMPPSAPWRLIRLTFSPPSWHCPTTAVRLATRPTVPCAGSGRSSGPMPLPFPFPCALKSV
jgi:hypothetical protein